MRVTWVLTSLLLASMTFAAEYQPSAEDWQQLQQRAEQQQKNYTDLNTKILATLGITHKETRVLLLLDADAVPAGSQLSYGALQDLLQHVEIAAADMDGLFARLKALPEAHRTRVQYLELLHKVKNLQRQCDQDWGRLSDGESAEREKKAIRTVEAQLKAARETQKVIPVAPLPRGLCLTWEDFPCIDGSTTAQPLSAMIACRLLGLRARWGARTVAFFMGFPASERVLYPISGASTLPGPDAYYDRFPGLHLSLDLSGTHEAYQNLTLGVCSLILVARPPSADELALAKEKGIELDARPIGYDAFIFLLNNKNLLNSLTVQQIQDIYQDNILNWSELDGSNEKVVAYQRGEDSGSQETMEHLVMKDLPMAPAEHVMIEDSMSSPYMLLPYSSGGIGYTFYYYHTVQSPEALKNGQQAPIVKICAVNGVAPTPDTIRNRTYPFVTEVYAVVRKDQPAESSAVRLRDWLLTPEGQALVKESGYVPLPVK